MNVKKGMNASGSAWILNQVQDDEIRMRSATVGETYLRWYDKDEAEEF